jgi:ribokinase
MEVNKDVISQKNFIFLKFLKRKVGLLLILIFVISVITVFLFFEKITISLNNVNTKISSTQKSFRVLNQEIEKKINGKKKILFIGSTGCDLIINLSKMPKTGETVLGNKFTQKIGGKGISQAIAAARLGAEVAFLGANGDDACGENNKKYLEKNNIKHYLKVVPKMNTQISYIMIDDDGQYINAIVPGANNFIDEQQIDENEKIIDEYDIIVLQLEIPLETVEYIIDIAYKKNKIIILNLSPVQYIPKNILKKCNYIILDKKELSSISGMPTDDEKQIELASQKIFELGIQNLIVILGEDGTFLYNKDNTRFFNVFQVYVKGKTNGVKRENDCYVGAFANYLSMDYSLIGVIINTNFAYRFYAIGKDSFPTKEEMDYFASRMSFYT